MVLSRRVVSERPSQEGKMSAGAPNDPVAFGKYYLRGLIARGGMAEVYRGRSQTERRLVAVKVMRPQLAREARFIDMFHREGKLAMMLKNRCIVETFEIGQFEARHYIAMEYIGGRDLTQVLRRCQETQQRIPVPHAVYIAARIAEGLHFAHTLTGADSRPLNIVNRDVSPSNVRLSYDGDVKLLDFGIAQALVKFTSEIAILKGKFMRQLFRKEFAKEVEDTQMSLEASLTSASLSMSGSHRTQTSPQLPLSTGTPTDTMARLSDPTEPVDPTRNGDKPRGFWGSL